MTMKTNRVITIKYNDVCPPDYLEVNCTSRSHTKYRNLSPFMPCDVTVDGLVAKNVENAWQFSKVYKEHESNGVPNTAWYDWRLKGFNDTFAHRYPMGKGKTPLYSFFDGKSHTYVEARKKLYFPLYIKSMENNETFLELKDLFDLGETKIAIRDFDVYNLKNISLIEAVNNPYKKAGHGFVLYHLLTGIPYEN